MIPYVGGKTYTAKWIKSFFPATKAYVEVFGGSASVLFSEQKIGNLEVYNDIDKDLHNLFKMLRDKKTSQEFLRRAKWMLHSRADFVESRKIYKELDYNLHRALSFAHYMCCGRSGKRSGMSFKTNKTPEALAPLSWQSFLKRIVNIRKRLANVIVECLDFNDLIKKYDTPHTFFYCDPPYLNTKGYYCVDWQEQDHKKLADVLLNIQGKFMVSYYFSDFIKSLYPGCYFRTKNVPAYVSDTINNKKKTATELLIMNYMPQAREITIPELLDTNTENII